MKKIKPIYIILGLFLLVLIFSALGSQKEGMTSGERTALRTYTSARDAIKIKIDAFINGKKTTSWDINSTFRNNVNAYISIYINYQLQNNLQIQDLSGNKDGIVIVNKENNKFVRDNIGSPNSNEKLFYYDLKAQDKNNDGLVVAYRNQDQGNFYRDNVIGATGGNNDNFPTSSPYILQSLGRTNNVRQSDVDAAKSLVDAQIATLSNSDEKNTINTLVNELLAVSKQISNSLNKSDAFTYDANDVIDGTYSNSGEADFWRQKFLATQAGTGTSTTSTSSTSGTSGTSGTSSTSGTSGTSSSDADYWKQRFLNEQVAAAARASAAASAAAAAATANQQTNTGYGAGYDIGYGAVSSATGGFNSAAATVAPSSLANPSYGSLLNEGQGIAAPGNEDMYMLKTQLLSPTCPVGGCGTSASNANNYKPAPVPPCPPCERCPEPAFDCKKVPNYNSAANNQYLPRPILTSFSQFGM